MSLMFKTYECTHCDYRYTDSTYSSCYYMIGELKVHMRHSLGWCHSCNSLALVEILPTAEQEAALAQGLAVLRARLEELQNTPLPKRRWWQFKARGLAERSAKQSDLEFQIAEEEENLADCRLLREVLSGRKGKGRCLQCLSEDNFILPPHDTNYYEPDPVNTGLQHPGCKGELISVFEDLRIYVTKLPEKLYDINGRLLETHINGNVYVK